MAKSTFVCRLEIADSIQVPLHLAAPDGNGIVARIRHIEAMGYGFSLIVPFGNREGYFPKPAVAGLGVLALCRCRNGFVFAVRDRLLPPLKRFGSLGLRPLHNFASLRLEILPQRRKEVQG